MRISSSKHHIICCILSLLTLVPSKIQGHSHDESLLLQDQQDLAQVVLLSPIIKDTTHTTPPPQRHSSESNDQQAGEPSNFYLIEFRSKETLGIQFDGDLRVMQFRPLENGKSGAAEKSGLIHIGDKLVEVNGDLIEDLSTADAYQVLQEAALESKRTGKPRRFKFRRGEKTLQDRKLSEETSMLQSGSHIEHIDIFRSKHEVMPIHTMLAEGIGEIPQSCKQYPIVFVEPRDGCSEESNAEDLAGAFAVVDRGTCSFHGKALNMERRNASGVLVINNEDKLFRMKRGEFTENEVTIPVAMISSVDAAALRIMQEEELHDYRRRVQIRLIASQDCYEMEEEEARLERAKDDPNKDVVQNFAPRAHDTIGQIHLLFGALAPSGRVVIGGEDQDRQDPQVFDFFTAAFSGPLPVGTQLRLQMSTSHNPSQRLGSKSVRHAALLWYGWHELSENDLMKEVHELEQLQKLACLILVSPNSSLWRQEGHALPSKTQLPVVMVSQTAGFALQQNVVDVAKRFVLLKPSHRVMHQWSELSKVSDPRTWPTERKARARLLGRIGKQADSYKEAGAAKSACWNAHWQYVQESIKEL